MPKSIEDRINELDAKKKALQAKMNKKKRTEDTRRKILLGSMVLAKIKDESIQKWVKQELPEFLTRDIDKKLFKDLLNNA